MDENSSENLSANMDENSSANMGENSSENRVQILVKIREQL